MRQKGPLKNFSYVAIGRTVAAGLQGVFYLIFAILLSPDVYGQMSYFIAIAGTFSIISRFGLPFSATVALAKKNQKLANQLNVLLLITTGAASIVLLFINIFVALLCLGLSFFVMTQHNLLGTHEYKKFGWNVIIKSILIIIIPVSLYFVFDLLGIILGMALGNILVSLNWLKSLKKQVFSFKDVKKSYKTLIHNFGLDSSLKLSRTVDKIVTVPLVGFAMTGIYQFNLQILFLMEILPNAIHVFLLSETSQVNKNKKTIYLAIISAGLLSLLVIILAPFVIELFFSKYQEGVLGLQIMAISLIPLTISAIFSARLQAMESTKIGYSAIVRIASLLILIVFLAKPYGFLGLGLAVLISILLNTGFITLLYYKLEKRN